MNPNAKSTLSFLPYLLLLLATGTYSFSQGQAINKSLAKTNKSHWVMGLTYLSDNVYLGRKDSVALPYLSPSIGYHAKSGLFFNGSFSYSTAPGNNRIDAFSFEGGWAHYSDHFNIELSASKDFYSDQSYSVKSEIGGSLSSYLSYDFGPIEPSLDLGAEIGTSLDFGVGLGIAHSITIIDSLLEISPSAKMNMSTQNFYANYYKNRRYSTNRKNNSGSTIAAQVLNAANFQIMDYEFSAPIEYTFKQKLKLNFTPTFAIPVNPATVSTTTKSSNNGQSSSTSQESLKNVFYYSLGLSYSF